MSETATGAPRSFQHQETILFNGKEYQLFIFNDLILLAKEYRHGSLEPLRDPIPYISAIIGPEGAKFIQIKGNEELEFEFFTTSSRDTVLHELKTAIKNYETPTPISKPKLLIYTGSLEITCTSAIKGGYLRFIIGFHESATESPSSTILLPIAGLWQDLEIEWCKERKYSTPLILGHARINLEFLEYFADKATDTIDAMLLDRTNCSINESLKIRIFYKKF